MKKTSFVHSWGIYDLQHSVCHMSSHPLIPCNRSKNEHNKKVKKAIEEEMLLNKENTYSKIMIERKCINIVAISWNIHFHI